MGGICTHVAADPGAQERRSIEGVQRMASGSIKFNPLFPCSISGYAGATLGAKKKQDRFILLPELAPGVLYCGVCDGHAEEGGLIAERAAKSIPIELAAQLKWLSDGSYGTERGLQQFETRISDVFTDTFTKFQSVLAEEYESQVVRPVEELRIAMEIEHGVDIPKSFPMKGGTTATTIVVTDKYLAVAWVGDSRAVLCCIDEGGALTAHDLTSDHNVESSTKERERAEAKGGVVIGNRICVDEAEGMVQVLRSLGDVPHHKNEIVTAIPEVTVLQIDPAHHAFVVVASDGVWGCFSSDHVVRRTYDELHASLAAHGKDVSPLVMSSVLLEACKKFEKEVEESCQASGRQRDDVVVCILAVKDFNFQRKPLPI
eukprot:CAMPEP_0173130868 /NCGR_PEP_ID=MMETSP1102-20130122/60296_1 /TAXON_ID=49646 /ORGANISM="Geminigera sp., Strain Caron Lab Isolate" /LENGTH=372 /DNA_ID=CAMNT_0014042065 /DNA_START=34 /DNA_END=1152 /DNA_ORIENTATION=-